MVKHAAVTFKIDPGDDFSYVSEINKQEVAEANIM